MKNAKPLLIFDWDCTLAEPKDRSFYANHREKTEQALKEHFNVSETRLADISAQLQDRKLRIEKLLTSPALAREFKLKAARPGDYSILQDSLNTIKADEWFEPDADLVQGVRDLKQYYDIVILSNSPETLIRKIGQIIGFDMDHDFHAVYSLTAEEGPPKFVNAHAAFEKIIKAHSPDIQNSWSLGDTIKTDLDPAQRIGMKTALIDNKGQHDDNQPYTAQGPIKQVLLKLVPDTQP